MASLTAEIRNPSRPATKLLWDDPDVVEFASLVSRANQIRALGN